MKKRRGSACVEFAIVLPVLMIFLLGIMEFGYVFMVKLTASHAAQSAVRTASLCTSSHEDVMRTIVKVMRGLPYSETEVVMNDNCRCSVKIVVPYGAASPTGGIMGIPAFNGDIIGEFSSMKEGCTPQ